MKLVLAITCSLLLLGTPFLSAAAMPCAKEVKSCCTHGKPMPCCAAKDNSTPQNAPAAPAQNNAPQHQVSLLILTAVTWTLPENPVNTISSTAVSLSSTVTAPLFARNCVRLI